MSADKSEIETLEDKIKRAAKEVEDFADKVTADEEPNVIVTDDPAAAADKAKKDR